MTRQSQSWLVKKLGNVRAASVINPLLWLDLLLMIGLLTVAVIPGAEQRAVTLFCWMFGASIVVTLGAFVFFAINDPDRLQTEPHRMQVLALQQQNQSSTRVIDVEPISNPVLQQGELP